MKLHLLDKSAATKTETIDRAASASRGLRIRSSIKAGLRGYDLPSPALPKYF